MPKIFFMILFTALFFVPVASIADMPLTMPQAPSLKSEIQVRPSPVPQETDSPVVPPLPQKPEHDVCCAPAPPTPEITLTGKLEGGVATVGGEGTGWLLHKYQDGTETGTIEIDLGSYDYKDKVRDGETVSVTGEMTTRKYVERGDVTVFLVTQLTEVKSEK